jgi:hypothetical protein
MFSLKYTFITLAILSLTACNARNTPAPEPTSPAEPAPTGESTSTPTPESTAAPSEPPQPTATSTPTSAEGKSGQANADVTYVRAVLAQDGSWTFHVTVAHPDTGWEDYADGWDVVTPDGTVIKENPDDPFTRLLLHPHENEQPFTRSQSGISIPNGVTQVRVRAHDLVDGFGGQEIIVDLEKDSGPGFEVER